MAKPTPTRVPSDDCAVTVDGQEWNVHEGEWIEVIPMASIADLRVMRGLNELRPQLEAVQGEPDQRSREVALMADAFDMAVPIVATRIIRWNWTDMQGAALPPPSEDVIRGLSFEEVFYLVDAIQGKAPAAEKNGSRPSPTSSWDTAPQPSQV